MRLQMDKFWKSIVKENVSQTHRDNVLKMASEHFSTKKLSATWRWSLSLAMTMAAITALWIYTHRLDFDYIRGNPDVAHIDIDDIEPEDLELVSELELAEDWEIVDQWSSI